MDVPVRVTGPGSAVRDADNLHMLDRYHLLLPARADPRDRVLAQPPLNLRQRILLRRIQRLRHLRVQRRRDRQTLRGVDDHLREPRRALTIRSRKPRPAHSFFGVGVDPVHPARVLLSRQRASTHGLAAAVEDGVADGGAVAQIIVVSAGAIRLDIAHGIGPGTPEQNHAALHYPHPRMFLTWKLVYLPW